jgi:putative hydrolase of the HAD superfamily
MCSANEIPQRVIMKVRAVIFDLDETLIEEESSNDASALAACEIAAARHGIDRASLLTAMRQTSRELWRTGPMFDYCREIGISPREGLWGSFTGDGATLARLRDWSAVYKIRAWTDALRGLEIDDDALAAEIAQFFERDRRTRHVVFPETLHVLDELKKHYKLAMITNGAIDIQCDKIHGANLTDFFDPIIISGELGFGKPNAKLFQLALERLAVKPEQCVMIGDSLNRDIAGASAVGIRTIWLNRFQRKIANQDPIPDLELTDLATLPTILSPAD